MYDLSPIVAEGWVQEACRDSPRAHCNRRGEEISRDERRMEIARISNLAGRSRGRRGSLSCLPRCSRDLHIGTSATARSALLYDLSPIVERMTRSENLINGCLCAVRVAAKTLTRKDMITEYKGVIHRVNSNKSARSDTPPVEPSQMGFTRTIFLSNQLLRLISTGS